MQTFQFKPFSAVSFRVVIVLGIVATVFQNCAPIKFSSSPGESSASQASVDSFGSAQQPVNQTSKLELKSCGDSSCLETGNQKLFFTDLVGRLLSAEIIEQTSNFRAKVKLVDERSMRSAVVHVRLLDSGYAALSADNLEKPWLCLDSTGTDNAGDLINSNLNCLSAVVMAGTKQRSQKTSELNFKSTVASLPFVASKTVAFKTMNLSSFGVYQELFSNFFISGFAGFGTKQLVVHDALGFSEGVTISSYMPLVIGIGSPAGVGLNLVLMDSEGRMASLDLKTKDGNGLSLPLDATSNFFIGNQIGFTGNIKPSRHPYLCFDHNREPLAIVSVAAANGQQRQALNCFASPRYTILDNYGSNPVASGVIPIHNNKLDFSQINTAAMAIDEQKHLEYPILAGPQK